MLTEIRAKAAQSTARVVSSVSAGTAKKRVPALSTVMMLTLMSVSSATSLPGSGSAQAAQNEANTTQPQTSTSHTSVEAHAPALAIMRFQDEAAQLTLPLTPSHPLAQETLPATLPAIPHATAPTPPPPPPAPPAPPAYTPPAASGGDTAGQPCQSTDYFVPNIGEWSVPPSCFGNIYTPSEANYGYRSDYGYCNYWPEALNASHPDILYGGEYHRGSVPVPGAIVYEAGGVQGASSEGHWAQVVAVAPDGYWMLITEMNFSWRGGGWGKVDYRYIHTGPGISFIYP